MTEAPVMTVPNDPGDDMTEAPVTIVPNDPGDDMTEAPMKTVPNDPGDDMTDDEACADTLRTITPEYSARAILMAVARDLGSDELRVLTRIAHRLKGGETVYGPLCLATDPREFRTKEAREEVEDALVYLACAWLKTDVREVTR